MGHAFWKGSLSFGLVEIPVALRPAVRKDDLSFTLLDRKDFSPVGNKRYNKKSGREVPWEQVVRGYEYEPDEYVVLSDEELRRANVEATQTIVILEFVNRDEIESVFFDTAYYVEPIKKGSKSYALLHETLQRTGKAAIARVVLRTRQHLAVLMPRGPVLVLNLLHYAHELLSPRELEAPAKNGRESRATAGEVKMAERLVQGMTAKWDPKKYRDEYRDDVMKLVERKVKSGETHTVVEPEKGAREPRRREVVDLMPLLKKSIEAQTGRTGRAQATAARRRTTKRPRRERQSA